MRKSSKIAMAGATLAMVAAPIATAGSAQAASVKGPGDGGSGYTKTDTIFQAGNRKFVRKCSYETEFVPVLRVVNKKPRWVSEPRTKYVCHGYWV